MAAITPAKMSTPDDLGRASLIHETYVVVQAPNPFAVFAHILSSRSDISPTPTKTELKIPDPDDTDASGCSLLKVSTQLGLFLCTPVSWILTILNKINFYFTTPKVLEHKGLRFITQALLSGGVEAVVTYCALSLGMWTYCGAPLTEAPNSHCTFEKSTWELLNFGVAVFVTAFAFTLRWLRIEWDVLPLVRLAQDARDDLDQVEAIHSHIDHTTRALSRPLPYLNLLKEILQRLQPPLSLSVPNDTENRSPLNILLESDFRNLSQVETRTKSQYSYLTKYLHMGPHVIVSFIVGCSVYFLCRISTDRLSTNPSWSIHWYDWLGCVSFGLLQLINVKDYLGTIEQTAKNDYIDTMNKLQLAITKLFNDAFFPLARSGLAFTVDNSSLQTKDLAQQVTHLEIYMRNPEKIRPPESTQSTDRSVHTLYQNLQQWQQALIRHETDTTIDAALEQFETSLVRLKQETLSPATQGTLYSTVQSFFRTLQSCKAQLLEHGVTGIFKVETLES